MGIRLSHATARPGIKLRTHNKKKEIPNQKFLLKKIELAKIYMWGEIRFKNVYITKLEGAILSLFEYRSQWGDAVLQASPESSQELFGF